jgi:hypothetical protein
LNRIAVLEGTCEPPAHTGVDENRQVGIMLHDGDDLSQLQQDFAADWQAVTPGY